MKVLKIFYLLCSNLIFDCNKHVLFYFNLLATNLENFLSSVDYI